MTHVSPRLDDSTPLNRSVPTAASRESIAAAIRHDLIDEHLVACQCIRLDSAPELDVGED